MPEQKLEPGPTAQAFDETLRHFRISAERLSTTSGQNKSKVSSFRNGRYDMGSESLFELLRLLPLDQYLYFCGQAYSQPE